MKCKEQSCKGFVTPVQLLGYNGLYISEIEQCSNCGVLLNLTPTREAKFKRSVDAFLRMVTQDWKTQFVRNIKLENGHEEAFAQAILQTAMPGYEIIQMDNGLRNSQYDLLARKDEHSIAIEVTQATNQNSKEARAILEKNNGYFKLEQSKYDWHIVFKDGMILSKTKKDIEQFLLEVEKNYLDKYPNAVEISYHDPCFDKQFTAVQELIKIGVISFSSKLSINSYGSMEIGLMGASGFNLAENFLNAVVFIRPECCKTDNIVKLSSANTDEKHLFIAITHMPKAGFSFKDMPKTGRYSKQEILEKLKSNGTIDQTINELVPDIINVVWMAVLFDYNKDGKMSFQLVKVTNEASDFYVEVISDPVTPYGA